MTRGEARKILRSKRGALAALAAELNVSWQAVADVIDGKRTSARIMAALVVRAREVRMAQAAEAAAEAAADAASDPRRVLCA